MTLDEKKELINSANSLEELEERKAQIAEAEEEEKKADEVEEKKEETPEVPKEEKISPEEERSLIRDTENLEKRSVSNQEFRSVERKDEMKENKVELRNTKEYIEAFANYIKTGEAKELRALITTQGYATGNSATVEVPDMVYDIVKTAWEREDLMRRVRTISVKGNLKVQFEVSASGAAVHTEGAAAADEESLVLGVVTLTPQSIKKWISISDEVVDMRGEEFLRYIYDELTYRIAKKCADILVGKIAALPDTLTPNSDGVYDEVSAASISKAPALGLVAEAIANLSDETRNITIVMNKLTYANFKAAQYAAGYPIDPFEGADVVFNNTLPAYDTASEDDVYLIVGDFDYGSLANYPNGDDINIKFDDTTLMTADLVRILGRRFVAAEPVADKSFTLITKPAAEEAEGGDGV